MKTAKRSARIGTVAGLFAPAHITITALLGGALKKKALMYICIAR